MFPLSRALFIFAFLGPAASAVMPFARPQPPEAPISKAKFIPAQEGLADLRIPLNMLAASPKVEFVDVTGKVLDHCSASLVSDEGTLLTAGHCVEECLSRGKALTKIDGISAVDRARLGEVQCSIKINGQTMPVKILATNDCRGQDRSATSTVNIQCKGLDYAVLKIDDKFVRGQPCFRVSSRVPAVRSGVAAIGFPPLTARQVYDSAARDADGKGPALTPGEVIPFQNYCRRYTDPRRGEKEADGIMEFKDPKIVEALKRQVEGGQIIQTTTDVLRGVSGAGLADINSYSLVGVARSYIHNNANKECVGSGFYTSTAAILASVKSDYPNLNLADTFRCDKNSFAPQGEASPTSTAPGHVPPAPSPQISR